MKICTEIIFVWSTFQTNDRVKTVENRWPSPLHKVSQFRKTYLIINALNLYISLKQRGSDYSNK